MMRFRMAMTLVMAGLLAFAGCQDETDPELTGLVSRDYVATYSYAAAADTVFVLLGTKAFVDYEVPAGVTIEPDPVPGSSLRFTMHIRGLSLRSHPQAFVGSRWSGDTLRVWCAHDAPTEWAGKAGAGKAAAGDKDPWSEPFFVPHEVSIGAPAGIVVRYLGTWFE